VCSRASRGVPSGTLESAAADPIGICWPVHLGMHRAFNEDRHVGADSGVGETGLGCLEAPPDFGLRSRSRESQRVSPHSWQRPETADSQGWLTGFEQGFRIVLAGRVAGDSWTYRNRHRYRAPHVSVTGSSRIRRAIGHRHCWFRSATPVSGFFEGSREFVVQAGAGEGLQLMSSPKS
jgi:hypothetical protein